MLDVFSFPASKFEYIEAKITAISKVETPEGFYFDFIINPEQIDSNINLTENLSATAKIIVKDMTLLEKISQMIVWGR